MMSDEKSHSVISISYLMVLYHLQHACWENKVQQKSIEGKSHQHDIASTSDKDFYCPFKYDGDVY